MIKKFSYLIIGKWKYSNTNYLILGKIIESITNKTLEQVLKQKIFDQAGMTNTYYMPEHNAEQIINLATGYQFGNSMMTDKNYYLYNAAGGIVSTLSDMNNFVQWLINSKYLDKMTFNTIDCLVEHGYKN